MSDVDDGSDAELEDEFGDFDPLDPLADADEPPPPPDEAEAEDAGDGEAGDGDGEAAGDGEGPAAEARPAAEEAAEAAAGTRRVIVVPDDERLSSNVMTLAEVTRAIALRAQQIATNPYIYTDAGDLDDAVSIARKELFDRRSPLVLERRMGRTPAGESIIEMWAVREMSYPPLN